MKHLLTTAALLWAGAAYGADMPKTAAVNAYAAVGPSWAGFYLGAHGGYGFGDVATFDEFKLSPKGFVGGGQVGYNWQYGQVVAGVEVDATWMGKKDSRGDLLCAPVGDAVPKSDCSIAGKYDLIGSARARLGTTIFGPRLLAYGTGGLAWGHAMLADGDTALGSTRFGWTAGGGLEFLLADHWTVRVEGLHYSFGSDLLTKGDYNVVRAGANFKF
jgi:outer membrane immunogenic protein